MLEEIIDHGYACIKLNRSTANPKANCFLILVSLIMHRNHGYQWVPHRKEPYAYTRVNHEYVLNVLSRNVQKQTPDLMQ
jgi:hypothetical protein